MGTIGAQYNHFFRFKLPHPDDQIGLYCGQYLALRVRRNGHNIIRLYSPVSRNSTHGRVDFVIKCTDQPLPPTAMQYHMLRLKPGDKVDVKGPMGGFTYRRNTYRHLTLIAGGTGITPMVQIIRRYDECLLLHGMYVCC